jgi:hypothetical protein
MQELILGELRKGDTRPKDDPTLRAVVAAAFGCLTAAQVSWLESGSRGTFAAALDQAMAAVTPQA